LPNGDLDRTHRQQAFLDSVLQQVRSQGVLGDIGRIQALLSVAKRYVITDAGWNLLDFATQARSLTGGNITFRTLPIKGYAVINGQDANQVDPTYLKALVHGAFYPKPSHKQSKHSKGHAAKAASSPSPGTTTVDVLNGGYTTGLAGRVSSALTRAGYRAGRIGNASTRATTTVSYGPGGSANASRLAALFGVTATASSSVAASHVEIMLGTSASMPHISAAGPSTASKPKKHSVSTPATGPQGGAVHAKNGIPCVN
jgi:hypothetical protein